MLALKRLSLLICLLYYTNIATGETSTVLISDTPTSSPTVPTSVPPTSSPTVPTSVPPTTSSPTVLTSVPPTTSSPTVPTSVPPTSSPTESTSVPTTSSPTVPTSVPTTISSTVSTSVPTTSSSTESTSVPPTSSSTVSTSVPPTSSSTVKSSVTPITSATSLHPTTTTIPNDGNCDIPSDSSCPSSGTSNIADPFDCTQFYLCADGDLAFEDPLICPENMYFYSNETLQECVPDGGILCKDQCYIKKTCSLNDCNDSSVVSYPDNEDCSRYYVCDTQGNGLPATCAGSDQYFDGEGCTDDSSQCCSETQCAPYCGPDDGPLTQVADPCDCSAYYVCQSEGSVPVITGICDEGQIFNADDRVCEDGIFCDRICPNQFCISLEYILKKLHSHH